MSLPSTPLAAITLRPETSLDRAFLFELYADTRRKELADAPWDESQKLAFLQQQFAAQCEHYHAPAYNGASYQIIMQDREPIGRLYTLLTSQELRIVDIALLERSCGRGVGSQLIRQVLAIADAHGVPTTIHVEMFNPALALYERLGFVRQHDVGPYWFMSRPARSDGAQPKTA